MQNNILYNFYPKNFPKLSTILMKFPKKQQNHVIIALSFYHELFLPSQRTKKLLFKYNHWITITRFKRKREQNAADRKIMGKKCKHKAVSDAKLLFFFPDRSLYLKVFQYRSITREIVIENDGWCVKTRAAKLPQLLPTSKQSTAQHHPSLAPLTQLICLRYEQPRYGPAMRNCFILFFYG